MLREYFPELLLIAGRLAERVVTFPDVARAN
jgi:hypothetical protein